MQPVRPILESIKLEPLQTKLRQWTSPSRKTEVWIWIGLILLTVGVRCYLVSLVPVYLWSDDAGSYADPAFRWFKNGFWVFDARRGPTYSLFIGYCVKLFGSFDAVMIAQHAMGAVSILMAAATVRILFGKKVLWPLVPCAAAYAVYSQPLFVEHLIRNETLLFFCSTTALCAWALALKWRSAFCLVMAGLSASVLTLTKNVFLPFPLVVIAGALYFLRGHPAKMLAHAGAFAAAFVLPFALLELHDSLAETVEPPKPQSGLLLYARVAQWTYLDGGIRPDLKAQFRGQIEDYRKRKKLDNNYILKRSVVPLLRDRLHTEGKTATDLNRLCRSLAFEAIRTHPLQYAGQVLSDLEKLHFDYGESQRAPTKKDLLSVNRSLKKEGSLDKSMRRDETLKAVAERADDKRFELLHVITKSSWLFYFAPGFPTTLLLCFLLVKTRAESRFFWAGLAMLWVFTLVLLSTVGRPMERYFIPVHPLMFFVLTGGVLSLWQWLIATERPVRFLDFHPGNN